MSDVFLDTEPNVVVSIEPVNVPVVVAGNVGPRGPRGVRGPAGEGEGGGGIEPPATYMRWERVGPGDATTGTFDWDADLVTAAPDNTIVIDSSPEWVEDAWGYPTPMLTEQGLYRVLLTLTNGSADGTPELTDPGDYLTVQASIDIVKPDGFRFGGYNIRPKLVFAATYPIGMWDFVPQIEVAINVPALTHFDVAQIQVMGVLSGVPTDVADQQMQFQIQRMG